MESEEEEVRRKDDLLGVAVERSDAFSSERSDSLSEGRCARIRHELVAGRNPRTKFEQELFRGLIAPEFLLADRLRNDLFESRRQVVRTWTKTSPRWRFL